ncbi:MAG: carbohydrate-binding protein [Victivallales bacterium]|nr:carbohydrate-binding protein [Victivallales bacterium]
MRLPCLSLLLAVTLGAAPAEFFVSPAGSDRSPGTKARPFLTLERARQAVRASERRQGSTVYLRGGIYERTTTFALAAQDSGRENAPVVWRSFPGETARLVGGRAIAQTHVQPVTDRAILDRVIDKGAHPRLRQIDLRAAGIEDLGKMRVRGFRRPYAPAPLEMFVDDTAMRLARWPNDRAVRIGKVHDAGDLKAKRGGTFEFGYDRPKHWQQATDIWLSGYWGHGFADDTLKVKSIDLERTLISLVQPHRYGVKSGRPFHTYYALNLLEEIDQPGEYFVDRKRGMLYFLPPRPLNNTTIMVSILEEPMVAIEGASHVHLRDLTLEAGRGMGIYVEGGTKNIIGGCTIRNFGIVGVCIGKGISPDPEYRHNFTGTPVSRDIGSWHEHIYENPVFDREAGTDHLVTGCDIYNTGAGGVHLGGGDRGTLVPAGNTVANCHIHHVNRLDFTYRAAVNIDGCGNRIRNCYIHDCAGSAIYLHGNDHLIEYNEVAFACTVADDMGAFYMGRDPSEQGNVIRYNFWHHIGIGPRSHGTNVIYLDDGACGTKTYGNVFYKGGKGRTFLIGGGRDNPVTDNILIESNVGVHIDNRLQGWAKNSLKRPDGIYDSRLSLVKHDQAPYAERYPELVAYWDDDPARPKRNPVTRNLFVDCRTPFAGNASWGPVENNAIVGADPGFRNWGRLDFRLAAKAAVLAKMPGFKMPPLERMGLMQDEYRTALPRRTPLPFPAPAFTPANGALIAGEGKVVISSRLRDGEIRYTIDGSEPTAQSLLYTAPFAVPDGTAVKARDADPQTGQLGETATRRFVVIEPAHPLKSTPDGWLRSGDARELHNVKLDAEGRIGHCEKGDYVVFGPFTFGKEGTYPTIEAVVGIDPKYAKQKTTIRLDRKDGPIVGTFIWQSTGSFYTYKPQQTTLTGLGGTHLLYLVMEGSSGVCNLERFRFLPAD